MVYNIHILGLVFFKFCKLAKQQSMLYEFEIHVHSDSLSVVLQDNKLVTLKRHDSDLLSDRIYQVYTRFIL
jgi:hypothetical protein